MGRFFGHRKILRMRLLERYVLAELLRVFLTLVVVSTSLLVFAGVYSEAKEHGLGPAQIFQILPFVAPSLLPYTIPSMMLLAVCVVYGRMSGDREVIAARAAGIHVFHLIRPAVFLGGLFSLISLLITDQVIPWSFANIERVVTLAMEDIFLDQLRTQNHMNIREQRVSVRVTDVKDRTLVMPTICYTTKGGQTVTIQAQRARIEFDLARQQVTLHLVEGYLAMPGKAQTWFEEIRRAFPLPSGRQRLKARSLRLQDVQEAIADAEQSAIDARQKQSLEAAFAMVTGNLAQLGVGGMQPHQYEQILATKQVLQMRTELNNRFAMSSSCFFFVLVGGPFAIFLGKNQFLTSFLFCFIPILVVYYPVSMMTQNMSKTGTLDPTWAVWCANCLMLAAAVYFLRRVTQN